MVMQHESWSVVTEGVVSPKVVDSGGRCVCHTTYAPTNALKHAHLMAAAPDLLEALQGLMIGAEAMGWNTANAKNAIEKATGVKQ